MSSEPQSSDPIDPDVDLAVAGQQLETRPREWDLLVAIGAGGVVGAEARYGMSSAIGVSAGFPWATFVINVTGCLLIGILMGVIGRLSAAPRLLRPFLGVGILGGYTTFSTFSEELRSLFDRGCAGLAIGYAVASLVGCTAAAALGQAGIRRWRV